MIDTDKVSEVYREKLIDREHHAIRFTNFLNTEQETDFAVPPNCLGFGRIHHFKRRTRSGWLDNPLPIDPATNKLNMAKCDEIEAEVFQTAACNWRCWYCYVPFNLLSADPHHSEFLPIARLLDLFMSEARRPRVIDLSGGQPDLTPELVPWVLEELATRHLDQDYYVWSDDNLSNDFYWRYLSNKDREIVAASKNYGRVCCFKGFDESSFAFNTSADPALFARQFELIGRLLRSGIDIYCYVTFTSPPAPSIERRVSDFVDRLQELSERLPLRTIPLEVRDFTPLHRRMNSQRKAAMVDQWAALEAWKNELVRRFSGDELRGPIQDVSLRG